MLKIDWFLFFRHRVIFGFHLRRKRMPDMRRKNDPRGPWILCWKWNWTPGIEYPWHRCWVWQYVDD